jgi:Kef-type K+ transport system membrane component KefB
VPVSWERLLESNCMDRIPRIALFVILAAPLAWAAGSGHRDPVAPTLIALIVILAAAKIGSELFERLHQSAVLGELLAGIVLGNLVLIHPSWDFFEPLRLASGGPDWAIVVDQLARIGVVILLFEVGLESTVQGMLKVGGSSFLVAAVGVVAPFGLGYGISWLMIRELPAGLVPVVPAGFSLHYIHLFIGAVLCATSVGITARVLKDLGKMQRKESQIILGAAVIDDVLGLLILAVIAGVIAAAESGQPLEVAAVVKLAVAALVFLGGSLVSGVTIVPRIMSRLARLRTSGVMLISALLFAFGLSYIAALVGLAPIVGAFAAGLILEEAHFRGFRDEITIEKLLHPIATMLVPIFFVLMGIGVRLETFANMGVLGLAAGLTAAAILGKQVCGLGVLDKGLDRVSVGVGMIPRGEVGLIFAGIGRELKVIDDGTFSAVVIMVMLTTLCTPPVLKYTLARWDRRHG